MNGEPRQRIWRHNLVKNSKRRIRKYFLLLIFVLSLFVIPDVCIVFSGDHEWFGRLLAIPFGFLTLSVFMFCCAFQPDSRIIRKGAKLNSPQWDRSRPYIILVIRILALGLGCVILIYEGIPYVRGVVCLAGGGELTVVHGRVSTINTNLISQEIVLETPDGNKKSCHFRYPMRGRIHKGTYLKLIMLCHSNLVLQVENMPNPPEH